jgi:8-oxo-dGTP pyrophosphatase MutT (NUDIX family)
MTGTREYLDPAAGDRAGTTPGWFDRLADALRADPEPPFRFPRTVGAGRPREAAVLALFSAGSGFSAGGRLLAGGGPDVLLTQRSTALRAHAGQVSFPGGRVEPEDGGVQRAALREAQEETGLDPAGVELHGTGPELYMAVSDFLVTPVLGWWRRPGPVAAMDAAEVERVVRVPLAELTDPANRFQVAHPSGFRAPGFAAQDLFVWGFTAMVLTWLLRLAGLEQPWDADRVVPLPVDAARRDVPFPGSGERA